MKFHIFVLFIFTLLSGHLFSVSAQVDSVIGQVSSAGVESFAGGISGNGRFIVFESTGDLATQFPIEPDQAAQFPRNTDGNREIFLFDYAQRRIFQITNTKSLLNNAANSPTNDNIRVDIVNLRPVISNDGRWIAFSSNATCAYPGNPTANPPLPPIVSSTNPGNFDPNAPGLANPCNLAGPNNTTTSNLVNDGNTEMWLYQIPAVAPVADLSAGDELPLTNLSGGAFIRVTNTLPSRLPVGGTTTTVPIIADDNHDASINDNGEFIAFTSNRDLTPCPTTPSATCGNAFPSFDNDEIFWFNRTSTTLVQTTATPRGAISNPIYNANPVISGNGLRVAFMSNANNPISGMTGGSNTDNNEEIFYADLDASGVFTTRRQVTATTRTNPGDIVNIWNYGRRMSRDGRYLAFDSYADLGSATPGANFAGFATFVFDSTLMTNAFRQISMRSDADAGASGGDIQRYPGFTDYDANGVPQTLVMTTRMNIKPDGTIPSNPDEGLNNVAARPAQIYSYPLNVPSTSALFTRLTKLPTPSFFLASIQAIPSNSRRRMTFNLAQTEVGTGNGDLSSEVYYYLLPVVENQTAASLNFATGASRIPVTASPVPSPSPTATPTPSPTPTGSPTPTPTPQSPTAVQGVSRGMLAVVDYNSGTNQPVIARTAVGGLDRRFTLPIELSGVTMTINGAAAGLKSVSQRQIQFVVPPGLAGSTAGTVYPVVINNNGTVIKGNITVVPTRPDIFTMSLTPGPGGRAKVFNVTNRVFTTEPFTTTTFKLRGSRRVPSVLRLHLTGVHELNATTNNFMIRIGSVTISGSNITSNAVLFGPGEYTIDFVLPANIAGAGDRPIIFSATFDGVTYTTRLDDTAPRIFIL